MASTRPLILWLLEQGHQPQALQLDMQIGTADWQEAAAREAELLQEEGKNDIRRGFLEQLRELGVELETLDASSDSTVDSSTTIWYEHAQARSDLSDELRQTLEQAIALREQGNPDQSRELLEQQANQGMRSPWLADNLARCLVDLDRKAEALTIWQALAKSTHAGVAEPAADRASQVESGLMQDQQKPNSIWQEHAQASSELSDELRQILEQAIDLREQGNFEESRALLELQVNLGVRSPWLAGNMARCLMNLERKPEALEIWQALAQSPDAGVAEQAVGMAAKIEAELVTTQSSTLSIWEEHAKASSDLSDELHQLLDEAIALREQGNSDQSLELLEQQAATGVRSPWLAGNLARCLANLDRRPEALEIWHALAQSPDAGVAEQAVGMAAKIETELVTTQSSTLSIWEEHAQASTDLSDELRLILDQAIALREQGNSDQSLELLKQQAASGVRSPWLAGNMARCLANLGDKSEARKIWQALAQSPDTGVEEQAIKMAKQIEASLINTLHRNLQGIVEFLDESLQHVLLKTDTDLESIAPLLLKEAVRLREAGQPQCSLDILQALEQFGLTSDWSRNNQAHAFADLGRNSDAITIWKALTASVDTKTAAEAAKMLEQQRLQKTEQSELTLTHDLNRQLQQYLELEGIKARHLPNIAPQKLADLEILLLKESISLREEGRAELSIKLLDAATNAGMKSPWINDNRARALVNLKRYSEAITLWQGLQESGIPALEKIASEMLERNFSRGREQQVLLEIDYILNKSRDQASGREEAITRLTHALLENPECNAWQERLYSLAASQENETPQVGSDFPELLEHEQALTCFDIVLSSLESRAHHDSHH